MMPASEDQQARIATTSAPDEEVIDESNRRLRQRLFCASLLDLVRQGAPTLSEMERCDLNTARPGLVAGMRWWRW